MLIFKILYYLNSLTEKNHFDLSPQTSLSINRGVAGQSVPGSAMDAFYVALGWWGGLLCFVPFPAGPACRARLYLVIKAIRIFND